jgi:phage shock protein A
MMSFNQGDQSDTLERMTEKIEERAAKAQAKVELATSGVDARMQEIRRATVSSEVEEKLLEYKRQLGLAPPEEDATKTMQPIPEQPESTGN